MSSNAKLTTSTDSKPSNNQLQATRPYHSWQGNNTICCDGRIIGGPQQRNFFYTLILIILPSISFTCFVCVHYMKQYSQYYVLYLYLIIFIITVVSFALTAFSDPGIIPRGILPPHVSYKGPVHLKQRMCISGQLLEIKWCGTCHVFRPPRSFHCYICNNCVERFDHHCPWIGNCIGLRNYAYFSIFVNSLQLLCFWALAHCIKIVYLRTTFSDIAHKSSYARFKYAFNHEYIAFFTAVYVFIGMWFVIGLTWFHWFLVFVGKTTNEQLRNLHPSGSPFKRSCIGNIMDHCCQFPATSVHLHHITPTTSYNELYVNKQKVVLLDNAAVQKHQEETHSKHIQQNSPFKACLIKNFGYKDVIKPDTNYTNGTNRNGYSSHTQPTHIQMSYQIKHNRHNRNGYDAHMETDGKIEEELVMEPLEEKEEKQQTRMAKIEVITDKEENKYDHIHDMEEAENSLDSNSKSQSRNDENIDQDCIYNAYDDEEEDEEEEDGDEEDGIQSLHPSTQQYSRSVTPVLMVPNDMDPDASVTPEQPLVQSKSNTNSNSNLHGKPKPVATQTALKSSVPSGSPGSDQW